ncbi:MAG: hypothetical protein HQL12_09535 [Candidatus Omnitrophica bacterium]|nr:hypothetical protein [Candidatus Omnitrophota bacterium]
MQKEIIATDDYTPVVFEEERSIKDLFEEIMNQVEEIPCDQCGYIDCVCTNVRFEFF